MHSDPKLSDRLRLAAKDRPLTERVMFGGVAFFLNGNVCCGIYHKALVLRIGEERAEPALKKPHVRPMDLTGKPMRGWVFVDPPGCKTKRQLDGWVALAADFVGGYPGIRRQSQSVRKRSSPELTNPSPIYRPIRSDQTTLKPKF